MYFFRYFIKTLIRKIVNIIFKPKNFFVLLLIILLTFSFLTINGYCASPDYVYGDPNLAILKIYDSFASDFVLKLNNFIDDDTSQYQGMAKAILSFLKNSGFSYFISYEDPYGNTFLDGYTIDRDDLFITFYPSNETGSYVLDNDALWGSVSYVNVLKAKYSSSDCICYHIQTGQISVETIDSNTYFTFPTFLYGYRPTIITDYITSRTSSISADLGGILDEAKKQTAALDSVNNNLEDLNNFLSDSNVSDGSYDTPSVDSPDNTEDGFNQAFTMITNTLTSTDYKPIELPLPFVKNKITIDPNFLYDLLGPNNLIVTLVSALSYFFVSSFIVKDISRILEKIKSGDIATSAETNIKTDMF